MTPSVASNRTRNLWVGLIVALFLSQAALWSIAIYAVSDEPVTPVRGK